MIRCLGVVLVCALTLFASVVPARAETPAAFLGRVKALERAARPQSEIEMYDITAQGLSGTDRIVRRGDDQRETQTLGPFVTERGKRSGMTWHQNDNGYTILDEPEPSQNTVPATQTLTRIAHPRDLWVLTSAEPSGLIEKTFYDPADLAIVAEEVHRGNRNVHISYDDFRRWNGAHRRAWHAKGYDDRGNIYEARLISDDIAATVDDSGLAIPPNRRTLVEFPAGTNQVPLPATVTTGRIHVAVDINGAPLTFVLDTGASGIFLNSLVAKELKLPSYGSAALTVAGTFSASRVIAPTVSVGPLVMHNVVMTTGPLDQDEYGDRVVGLLGYDFIAGAVLRIDYIDPGHVDAIRPSVFTAPLLATSTVPIRLNQQVPVIHVGIGDAASDDMVVDTGAEAPVILFDRFVQAHPAAVLDHGFSVPFDPAQNVMYGVGGRIAIRPLRLGSFRFADLEFKNYIVLRAEEPGAFGDFRDDGLLGALFLRFYTLYVDYPDRRLFFEPNENYKNGIGKPLNPS